MKRLLVLSIYSLITLIILTGCSIVGGKQTVDQVTGVVKNLYGEPIVGATVKIAELEATTTQSGSFSFPGDGLKAGTHRVTVYLDEKELYSEELEVKPKTILQIFVNDDGNILLNPGFELGFHESGNPIGWRGSPYQTFGDVFQIVPDEKRSGESALAIIFPEDRESAVHVRTDEQRFPIPVSPGEVYDVTAYAYNNKGNRILMMVVFLDSENREISGSSRSVATENDTWTELNVRSRPAPDNAKQLRIMFWQTTDTKGSITYVDDVYLVKVEE